jgi:hypothetical protein
VADSTSSAWTTPGFSSMLVVTGYTSDMMTYGKDQAAGEVQEEIEARDAETSGVNPFIYQYQLPRPTKTSPRSDFDVILF